MRDPTAQAVVVCPSRRVTSCHGDDVAGLLWQSSNGLFNDQLAYCAVCVHVFASDTTVKQRWAII